MFRLLEWDSNAFGFAVARMEALSDPISELPPLCAALREAGVRLAYWEAPVGDADSRRAAESNGGRLVSSRVEFHNDLNAPQLQHSFRTLSQPNSSQLAALETLALASGWSSRFALDPDFPSQLFEQLYHKWLENSLNGSIADAILVAGEGDMIDAMVTVSAKAGIGQIGLFSVSVASRGKGVGKKLLNDALAWFTHNGCSTATVATQGENAAAIALYQSCGFSVRTHNDAFHFWNYNS